MVDGLIEEGEAFKTSLELKVDDLFVQESSPTGRESESFRAICRVFSRPASM